MLDDAVVLGCVRDEDPEHDEEGEDRRRRVVGG